MINLLLIAAFALIWFVVGVMSARYVLPTVATATATATATYNDLLVIQQIKAFGFRATFNAYIEVLVSPVTNRFRAGAAVAMSHIKTVAATVAAHVRSFIERLDGLVIATACDLPDTSMYALSVLTGSVEYRAGEYLVRDNGAWRNVFLTVHARALMGHSSDVIELSPATVADASGSFKSWHLSVA